MIDEVVDREGRDADLRSAAERSRCWQLIAKSAGGGDVHICGLRDPAEDAAVLSSERPVVVGETNFVDLLCESLLSDFRQVAETGYDIKHTFTTAQSRFASLEQDIQHDTQSRNGEVDPAASL